VDLQTTILPVPRDVYLTALMSLFGTLVRLALVAPAEASFAFTAPGKP
jgi:hypothetical protein